MTRRKDPAATRLPLPHDQLPPFEPVPRKPRHIVYPERLPWQAVEGASSPRCSSRASSRASAAFATTGC